MLAIAWIILFLAVCSLLAYQRASLIVASIALLIYLILVTGFSHLSPAGKTILWLVYLIIVIPLNILPLRRILFSKPLFSFYQKTKPTLSNTEKEALAIGTVGWEGELFSGMPDWRKFAAFPAPQLSAEEQAFLAGPVEQLCQMLDNWDINHNRFNLPPEVWQFLKEQGFFSFIIPKKYGGKEFSALAHSAIIAKISGRSIAAATVVGVPNSLGPGELLLHYGTEEQKDYYLPRLARGEEIPCFALTSPDAGSDAGSMPDHGIVCRGLWQGEEVLGIKLHWDKRYITLAPVATLLGLAFKLYDPEHLLGGKTDLGITCALISTNTPGITIGRRHCPVSSAFPNGPTQGREVFVPVDAIIGGAKMAGQGWHMLMECLSVGRAITLPSLTTGCSKVSTFTTGAYARIRTQFNMAVGRFEGVEDALASIVGYTYIMEATRTFAVAAIDRGEKPTVPSAISKYHTTELGRKVANHAMDVHGGKGICMGPRNYLAQSYIEIPISITVEGANILTRCMMIFGQGAMRCHPYLFTELQAAHNPDARQGLIAFDKAIFGHLGFLMSNKARAFFLAITQGRLSRFSGKGQLKRYYQKLNRYSAAFAWVADVVLITLGGSFKRRESLSGRLGDILSMLYLGSALLKHFENQGSPAEDLPLLKWSCQVVFFKLQTALDGVLKNLPNRFIASAMRMVVFPWGRCLRLPDDRLNHQVASLILSQSQTRARLTQGIYASPDPNNWVGLIDVALGKVIKAEAVEKKLHVAVRDGQVSGENKKERLQSALTAGILSAEEIQLITDAEEARRQIIAVDDFAPQELERPVA
ncbi:MAG TPA: acyl-CoA dehydrogenase [Gammaproteobacteria bacterium]|nr:acyl-CoA dehydrogenase [Gammaproteobacteria bacterium]